MVISLSYHVNALGRHIVSTPVRELPSYPREIVPPIGDRDECRVQFTLNKHKSNYDVFTAYSKVIHKLMDDNKTKQFSLLLILITIHNLESLIQL